MDHAAPRQSNVHKPVILVIAAVLILYALATLVGWTAAPGPLAEHADEGAHAADGDVAQYWAVIPFTLLLAAIAVLPLLEQTAHWWEHNLHKLYVAANLALITLAYIAFLHPEGSLGR